MSHPQSGSSQKGIFFVYFLFFCFCLVTKRKELQSIYTLQEFPYKSINYNHRSLNRKKEDNDDVATSSDRLVEEEILCRVPATSLKRLRATCKLWNGLFNNRRFAKIHFDRSAKKFLFLMLKNEYRIRSLSVELKGELGLLDPLHSVQFKITHVFHCDGLLLCTYEGYHRLVVWNPCTGQTKWLNHPVSRYKGYITYTPGGNITYTLGCYQDKKSHNRNYKILRLVEWEKNQRFEIYEIKSDSWRTQMTPKATPQMT